ncbi:hypothetical protein M9H77_30118 [Catharanthus roseus]|uniref:Uncharacterized protein n=1 Tax=Catharanthus roseus TaxID=4058 RepID=A0ACB9ZWQ9_CATRO|nr:hypothetical protein M9H77_30118 [Catharanthus roseus]
MTTSENWELFVHNGRQNHEIAIYIYGHAQAARLTEEQLQQTEQFRKSHLPPCNILRFFREQDVGCAVRNRMQRKNTVEEVLRLSAERGYTVFNRNREDNNVLSDIVVAHPTLIAMIRTWPYILIMDTTYKMNKYNMPLLECVGMTATGNNFTGSIINEGEPLVILTDRESRLMPGLDISGVAFWGRDRERTFCVKLWLSTCHSDLHTVFLNIDSLIQGQISEIKYTFEISKLKEKYGAKSNPIVKNLSNKISHLGLKKIMDKLKKVRQMVEEPESSGSGSGSSSGSNHSPRGRGRSPSSGRGRGRRRSSGRSSLSSVVNPDSPLVSFPFNNAFPGRMSYDLRHRMNVYEQLFGLVERVTELIMKTNREEGSAPSEY